MARPLRIEYCGAVYHITARGNERKPIFREGKDCQRFLEILSDLPQRFGAVIHGYALMGNHYHLLLETPMGNIAKAMHWVNATYTGYFNRTHGRIGHLLQGRYKGLLIEKERYLLAVSRYIHLNPVRANMVEQPEQYEWSSYAQYIGEQKRSLWLTCDWILRQFSKDADEAKKLYQEFAREGMRTQDNPFEHLKGGVVLGSQGFVDEINERMSIKRHREVPESRRLAKGLTIEETTAAVAERLGTTATAIREARKHDNQARKVCMYLLRTRTNLSNEEIAGYFGTGYTAVSHTVSRFRREMARKQSLRKLVEELAGRLNCQL